MKTQVDVSSVCYTCMYPHVHMLVSMVDIHVQAHAHSTHTGRHECVYLANACDCLTRADTRKAACTHVRTCMHICACTHSLCPASWCSQGWQRPGEAVGRWGRPPRPWPQPILTIRLVVHAVVHLHAGPGQGDLRGEVDGDAGGGHDGDPLGIGLQGA